MEEDAFLSTGSALFNANLSRPTSPGELDFFKPSSPDWRSNFFSSNVDEGAGVLHSPFGSPPPSTAVFGGLLGFSTMLATKMASPARCMANTAFPLSTSPRLTSSFPLSTSPPLPSVNPYNFDACDEQKSRFGITRAKLQTSYGSMFDVDDEFPMRPHASLYEDVVKYEEDMPPSRTRDPCMGGARGLKLDDLDVSEASDKLENIRLSGDVATYFDVPNVFATEPGTSASEFPSEGTNSWPCVPMCGGDGCDDASDDENIRCGHLLDDDEATLVDTPDALFMRCKAGNFQLERRVFLWQRELGIVMCSKEEGMVEVPQKLISRRADLQHIRCHYCVNGPNLMQKRSKWLTKCRRQGCNNWYCQTHYPMYAGVSGLDKSRTVLAELKALEHQPFLCRADRGLCCCSPSNLLCRNPQSKMCATFGKKSHKCEKVRHRVYNATKRRKSKAHHEDDEEDLMFGLALDDDDRDCGAKRAVPFDSSLPSRKRCRFTNVDMEL